MNETDLLRTARAQHALAIQRVADQAAVVRKLLLDGRDARRDRRLLEHLQLMAEVLDDHAIGVECAGDALAGKHRNTVRSPQGTRSYRRQARRHVRCSA